jgi:hypothetical protein
MKISIAVVLALSALSLTGCVDPKSLPAADFKVQEAPAPVAVASGQVASIKGTLIQSSGLLFKTYESTYLVAIDGKLGGAGNQDVRTPIPISVGPHSIVIGYTYPQARGRVPLRLDAQPGASYVIKDEVAKPTWNSYGRGGGRALYIEDEKTGALVGEKLSEIIEDNTGSYYEPADSDAARFVCGSEDPFFTGYSVCVEAVDGRFVRVEVPHHDLSVTLPAGQHQNSLAQNKAISNPPAPPSVKVSPGLHAFAVGIRTGFMPAIGYLPFMFDAKPNATYIFRFESGTKRDNSDHIYQTLTLWMEDAATHQAVMPKAEFPLY